MPQQKRNILITRSLSDQQREYARSLGLNPIERPALEFEFPDQWDHVVKVIKEHSQSDWVFTSQNGVKALKKMMSEGLQINPRKRVFAVGSKTQRALKDLGLEAKIPAEHDGYHLARFIIEEGKTDSAIYLRGNLSRSDLKDELINNDIEVAEVEVYKTIIRPVELPEETVDAILFYSPSSVEGFKRGQGFDQSLPPLFAIGPTTAKAIENEIDQTVKIADKPSTEILFQTVSNWLYEKEKI